jgi:hypothetical protein
MRIAVVPMKFFGMNLQEIKEQVRKKRARLRIRRTRNNKNENNKRVRMINENNKNENNKEWGVIRMRKSEY